MHSYGFYKLLPKHPLSAPARALRIQGNRPFQATRLPHWLFSNLPSRFWLLQGTLPRPAAVQDFLLRNNTGGAHGLVFFLPPFTLDFS